MFERLKTSNVFPSTSQITPIEFTGIFNDILFDENNEILCITLSSQLSGTCNSAVVSSRDYDNNKVRVIDSKGISLGYGMIVIEAAKIAQNGFSIDDIEKRVKELSEKMEYLIVFDSLEYVYKGGRISKSQYIMSNLLNIKVIMTLKDGQIVSKDKVRGRKKAKKYIIDYIENNNVQIDKKIVGMNHANDENYLEELKEALFSKYKQIENIYSNVGCTVAAYSGLSAVAIYYEKD